MKDRDRLVRELKVAVGFERVSEIQIGDRRLSAVCSDAADALRDLDYLHGLGLKYVCPVCRVPRDEGKQTGVYWDGQRVCGYCSTAVNQFRTAIASVPR